MNSMISTRGIARLAWAAALFALVVIVFGAFVRLSNAGLSCPDWPTCYGKVTWPVHEHEVDAANAAFPDRPVESNKAWREQVHRFLAGGLILTTFALAIWSWRRRRDLHGLAAVPLAASVFILFQALLGMWTVTWKLKPIVVMGHLLGGMTTFALLAYSALRLTIPPIANLRFPAAEKDKLWRLTAVGIGLVAVQIALGGWTSSNYAALACGLDFPSCLGQWWPGNMDFHEAFVLWRGIGVNYEGGVLDGSARIAIQLVHRIGAVLVFGHVAFAVVQRAARHVETRPFAVAVGIALLLQVSLGIANVKLGLPLPIATAHNGVAAVLLLSLLALLVRVRTAAR
ncbi:COX15/CtaA family protein [Rudaea cellulosilytica]|uniref:COX15/CtaA family protein n=1 Tax=Rudaea cellulosilytica TaxID=540746 RepID=UPI00036F93F5|nr:COX15/CtaA family protein [Rudaea cellulosilytica]